MCLEGDQRRILTTVQLQYEPKKHVKISVLRDEYGGYGVDVRYHKVF